MAFSAGPGVRVADNAAEETAAVRSEVAGSRAPLLSVRVRGVSRDVENERCVLLALDGVPTDDDLRALHDLLRVGA